MSQAERAAAEAMARALAAKEEKEAAVAAADARASSARRDLAEALKVY